MKRQSPNIKRLREIGWSLWDPIGLGSSEHGWKGQPFEDEYDTYLMKAAGMLANNKSLDEVVDYLFFIESQHMGLGPKEITDGIRKQLQHLVKTIAVDDLIWAN